jgi:hypothetical protein
MHFSNIQHKEGISEFGSQPPTLQNSMPGKPTDLQTYITIHGDSHIHGKSISENKAVFPMTFALMLTFREAREDCGHEEQCR